MWVGYGEVGMEVRIVNLDGVGDGGWGWSGVGMWLVGVGWVEGRSDGWVGYGR